MLCRESRNAAAGLPTRKHLTGLARRSSLAVLDHQLDEEPHLPRGLRAGRADDVDPGRRGGYRVMTGTSAPDATCSSVRSSGR